MEQDRADLVTAIIKLKESIDELNQKGRERLIEAFEKVNRKFNEVYTKLFNGGNAKKLVDLRWLSWSWLRDARKPSWQKITVYNFVVWRWTGSYCSISNFCSFLTNLLQYVCSMK